jgi:hypothetical protein
MNMKRAEIIKLTEVSKLDELHDVIKHLEDKHENDDVSIIRATVDPDEYYTDYVLQWRVKK